MPQNDVNIFIAYSREDADLLSELKTHLVILERTQNVKVWYDGMIEAGMDWQAEIKDALHGADIILLLISADFIASDYCYEHEMTQALELHSQGKVIAIPVILRECLWHRTPFAKLQALPKDGQPVASTNWDTPERPFVQIVEALEGKISDIRLARKEAAAKEAALLSEQEAKRKFEEAIIAGDAAKADKKWKLAKQHYELAASYHNKNTGINLDAILNKIKDCDAELEYKVNFQLAETSFAGKDYKTALVYAEKAAGFKRTQELKSLINEIKESLGSNKKPVVPAFLTNRKFLYGAGGIFAALILTFIGINVADSLGSGNDGPVFKQIADVNGQTYKTVLKGNTYWMTDNLSRDISPSWCYNPGDNCNNYFGRLYTWKSAQLACPAPFRLPSRPDWANLKNSYKSEKEAFMDLTTKGKSGLNFVLNGYGIFEGNSAQQDEKGHYWTSETDDKGNPYIFTLDYSDMNNPKIYEKPVFEEDRAFSCRCVVDSKTLEAAKSPEFLKANKEFSDLLVKGKKLMEEEKYKEAKIEFESAIKFAGEKPYLPIDVSEAKRLILECENLLKDSSTNNEEDKQEKIKSYLRTAGSYVVNKDYAKALQYFNMVLDLDPGNRTALAGVKECEKAMAGPSTSWPVGKPGSFRHPRGIPMKTVIIGDQEWLAENLNIKVVGKSFCYNKDETYCDKYGSLYPYAEARKSCNALGGGWRLPSNKDWAVLADNYGGLKTDASKKEVFNQLSPRGASNLDLSLGGHKGRTNRYSGVGFTGYYWSSTPDGSNAYYFVMRGGSADLLAGGGELDLNSCRCVRASN